jgi:hypothetical protein
MPPIHATSPSHTFSIFTTITLPHTTSLSLAFSLWSTCTMFGHIPFVQSWFARRRPGHAILGLRVHPYSKYFSLPLFWLSIQQHHMHPDLFFSTLDNHVPCYHYPSWKYPLGEIRLVPMPTLQACSGVPSPLRAKPRDSYSLHPLCSLFTAGVLSQLSNTLARSCTSLWWSPLGARR